MGFFIFLQKLQRFFAIVFFLDRIGRYRQTGKKRLVFGLPIFLGGTVELAFKHLIHVAGA